jgi:hypothetical protein
MAGLIAALVAIGLLQRRSTYNLHHLAVFLLQGRSVGGSGGSATLPFRGGAGGGRGVRSGEA